MSVTYFVANFCVSLSMNVAVALISYLSRVITWLGYDLAVCWTGA